MIKRIYFLNILLETGGPENIHQVCNVLAKNGYDAQIFYPNGINMHPPRFEVYKNKIANQIIPGDETLLVFPEFLEASRFKNFKCKKALWWLSLDNSPDLHEFDLKTYLNNCEIDYCFSQSQYAYDFLKSWKIDNVYSLPDYINEKYFINKNKSTERKKQILYNPKKGIEFTAKIIGQNQDLNFVKIQDMNIDQVIDLMDESMIYIDFGTHPGKDRIPREAAMRDLIVITNRNGAAQNNIDVPIPSEFKFDNNLGMLGKISEKIRNCLENYDDIVEKFDSYRNSIFQERCCFEKNVIDVFKQINHNI